ncbi:hypothetical protein BVI2075_150052 [Burkholderia vietnamiensis]|nr:hypothetical protein BVI2075_150052 [Burkholderia vietnamiensis]
MPPDTLRNDVQTKRYGARRNDELANFSGCLEVAPQPGVKLTDDLVLTQTFARN